jgi:Up-Regulated in long-lived daf-2
VDYTNWAYANVKNNTDITIKSLTLLHRYSDDPIESMVWSSIPGGATTTTMKVGYNTGFIRTGQDHWYAEYTLPDSSRWVSSEGITETLHAEDQGTTKTFTITGSLFRGFTPSLGFPKEIQLHRQQSPQYNTWAAIVLHNDFPVPVSAVLKHKYSNDVTFEHRWPPLAPGATTGADQAFIVYFYTGFIRTGSDHWNLEVKLDIPPYDNAPATAFDVIHNATVDKGCMLESVDNGKTHTFSIDGSGLNLGLYSGACSDEWKTWHGYNTLAFIRVQNDFSSLISTVVLSHQYSGDTVWRQTRALISPGELTPWMVAEYNTGFLRTGLDYWTVQVYLDNGKWYQNHKAGKECLLKIADAITPSTFSVSQSTFTLGLTSGACTDSMDDRGTFLPAAGRDATKRYDQNGFIGGHNAFANFEAGFRLAQQTGSVSVQLALGGTTLLLDIWFDTDDIYLMHEGQWNYVLQPFAAPQKLSDCLTTIKAFLSMQSRDPVTIVFQDEVKAPHKHLIKKAFETSGTWDMVFNPDTYNVTGKGWPVLTEFFSMGKPLIVVTSDNRSADFAYQWKYMSENVYGNPSLNQATWLDPRGASRPLNELALCALNHFPDVSLDAIGLPVWLGQAVRDNDVALLTKMIDACYARWKRYPNYINADFWEIPPDNGVIKAIEYLNQKLHGAPYPVLRFENGRAILSDIDHSRLLRGNWDRAAGWIDQHFAEICPRPDPARPGPVVYQLDNAINLALVVSILRLLVPPGDSVVTPWIQKTVRELVRYLLGIEPLVACALDSPTAAFDELCAIPYLAIERASEITFEVTGIARRNTSRAHPSADHDRLLLAGLAGHAEAVARLTARLAATEKATTEDHTAARLYDLTHEIFYCTLTGQRPAPGTSLASHLESLLGEVMPANQDLGAELLACYWIAGGAPSAASRTAAGQLKAFSEEQPSECDAGRDGLCRCPRFKEQVHSRLTTVLGLGATVAVAGEILDVPAE